MDDKETREIQVGNLSLHTESFGNVTHPACLLIAGAMATAHFWSDSFCLALVNEGFFVIRYDHRDIGKSSSVNWREAPYTLSDLVQDSIAILDAYGIKKAHFVGHSMGGFICQKIALEFRERVLSVTLLSAGPIGATSDTDNPLTAKEKAIQENTWKAFLARKGTATEDFLPLWRYLNGAIPFNEKMAIAYTEDLIKHSPDQKLGKNHELAMRSLDIDKCRGILKYIQIPTLIIHGEQDPLSLPRNGRALARAIPESKLLMINEMGHMLFNQELESKLALFITQHMKSAHKESIAWTPSAIQQAMEANMQLHMTFFASSHPNIELMREPDVTVVRSKIFEDTFNYAIFAKFTEDNVQNRIDHICGLFKAKNLPFSWWVGKSDTPAQLTETLLNKGFTFKEEDLGMVLDLDAWDPYPSVLPIDFQRVNSLKELKDFSQVIVDIGGSPDAFEQIYSKIPLMLIQEGVPLEMHIGYVDDLPVVTGVLVLHAHVAGIYYVATTPPERRKGYGTAMMEYLLTRAKWKGFSLATLQASHEGKNLYERIGFKPCSSFKEYIKL